MAWLANGTFREEICLQTKRGNNLGVPRSRLSRHANVTRASAINSPDVRLCACAHGTAVRARDTPGNPPNSTMLAPSASARADADATTGLRLYKASSEDAASYKARAREGEEKANTQLRQQQRQRHKLFPRSISQLGGIKP